MIGKNRKFRSLDFTESTQKTSQQTNWYSVVVQNVNMQTGLRTDINERANYHGSYSSETLANGRTFSFDCIAIWETKSKRATIRNTIVSTLQPPGNPWVTNRWFYKLYFQDDAGNDKYARCKVLNLPDPQNWLDDPLISFTFSLYCETEKIYWNTLKTASGGIATVWGTTFSTTFPTTFTWYAWTISCNNEWNWDAPMKVSVIGTVENPKIINVTNGQKYRIDKTTTNLILDNRNEDNNPKENLIVTDAWVNIKWYRDSWASVFLEQWINKIAVLADSYSAGTTVDITFRDTYIY